MKLLWAIIGLILLPACDAAKVAHEPPPAVAALPSTGYIDDSHFRYIGRWEHVRGRRDGRANGTSSRSWHARDMMLLTYNGSGLRLYGVTGPKGGDGTAAIDGKSYGLVNFYSRRIQPHSLVFEGPLLSEGVHTFGLIVNRTPHAPYRGFVNVDDAEVVP